MYYNYNKRKIAPQIKRTVEDIDYDLLEDLQSSLGMLNGILKPSNKKYTIIPISKYVFNIKIDGIKNMLVATKKTVWRSHWTYTINGELTRFNDVPSIESFMQLCLSKVEQVEYWLSSYDHTAWASDDSRNHFYSEGCVYRSEKILRVATPDEQKQIYKIAKKYKINLKN